MNIKGTTLIGIILLITITLTFVYVPESRIDNIMIGGAAFSTLCILYEMRREKKC